VSLQTVMTYDWLVGVHFLESMVFNVESDFFFVERQKDPHYRA